MAAGETKERSTRLDSLSTILGRAVATGTKDGDIVLMLH